ncbi:MAG: amidohydrolase family protein [Gemmatimonadota bacterium]|nr:MAG: amidohydrolase family protein [Gemmatimonadota bacterium]
MNRISIPLTLWVVLAFPHAGHVHGGEAVALRAIKAEKIYVGNGQTIDNGIILIRNGHISAVGCNVAIPAGTSVIEIADGSITPGLIDANSRIETINLIAPSRKGLDRHMHVDDRERVSENTAGLAVGVRANHVISEQGSEVVPHTLVLDGLNLGSGDFDRLLRGGVTTVYASPDPSCVISPRGAILHTGGPRDKRVLVPAAAVKATIGSEPSSFGNNNRQPRRSSVSMYARRPNSRMGLTWVFRKAFYDAIRRGRGIEAYGADTADPQASAVLRDVLGGKVGLRIQARIQQDILTALRLADEFKLKFTLEEGTEAYRCIEELKAASVPVIFGPIYEQPTGIRARSREARRSRYWTFRALVEAGIPTALSAQELREEDGLARQAMYAMRFGVGFDDALRAVTDTPARLLGLDGQLGTIEPGKRADLVIWKGRPLAATSIIEAVLIDGNVVMDRR